MCANNWYRRGWVLSVYINFEIMCFCCTVCSNRLEVKKKNSPMPRKLNVLSRWKWIENIWRQKKIEFSFSSFNSPKLIPVKMSRSIDFGSLFSPIHRPFLSMYWWMNFVFVFLNNIRIPRCILNRIKIEFSKRRKKNVNTGRHRRKKKFYILCHQWTRQNIICMKLKLYF